MNKLFPLYKHLNLNVFWTISAVILLGQASNFALAMDQAPEKPSPKPVKVREMRQGSAFGARNQLGNDRLSIVPQLDVSPQNLMVVPQSSIFPSGFKSQEIANVQLRKTKNYNPLLKEERDCYQFVDEEGRFPHCYDRSTFKSHLDTTDIIYKEAIEKIRTNAYRSLKPVIDKETNNKVIDNLLINFLDSSNEDSEIDATGSRLDTDEFNDIKFYMNLCAYIYTDYYTREFFINQNLGDVASKLDQIIVNYDEVKIIEKQIADIEESLNALSSMSLTGKKITLIGQAAQEEAVAQIDTTSLQSQINKKYSSMISRMGNLPIANKTETLASLKLKESECVDQKMLAAKRAFVPVKALAEQDYGMYFEINEGDAEKEWRVSWNDIHNWVNRKFMGGSDLRLKPYKNRNITPKGAVITSFLSKAGLIKDDIKIMDVGFRNQERYGTLFNQLVTSMMFFKDNKKASFDSWGEVDHISYIKKDPERKKDKLVIVYAGSNSQMDWGIDFTIGSQMVSQGLSVHAGIGWMFKASMSYHAALLSRLKSYYDSLPENERPQSIEVDITGHSLGGGLAQIAAHHYKTIAADEIKKETGIKNVSVKAYTFAAPAIVSEMSQNKFEADLGKENIYRVWVTNDIVPTVSAAAGIQGGRHVGRSIPLYNLNHLEKDLFDIWGPHGASYYQAFIANLKDASPESKQSEFIRALNNYIKKTRLDIFKKSKRNLEIVISNFEQEKLPFNVNQTLAEHICKYSPAYAQFIPPMTIADYRPDSPRASGALSPRFIVEPDKVKEHFSLDGRDRYSVDASIDFPYQEPVTFPIVASTKCSLAAMEDFLKQKLPSFRPTKEQVEQLSTATCLAKRVFVTQYPSEVSSRYFGHVLVGGMSYHQDTLTKMFAKCLEENATTVEYLKKTGEGKNIIDQACEILKHIGLEKKFLAKKVRFDRFQAQDAFEKWPKEGTETIWKRPGKEVPEAFYSVSKKAFVLNADNIDQLFSSKLNIVFTGAEIANEDSIYRKFIEATMQDNHRDALLNFLNYYAIQESFVNHVEKIDAHEIQEAITQIEELCALFKANILNGANSFYQSYKESKGGWGINNLKNWSPDNLEADLDFILNKIKRDNLWLNRTIIDDSIVANESALIQ